MLSVFIVGGFVGGETTAMVASPSCGLILIPADMSVPVVRLAILTMNIRYWTMPTYWLSALVLIVKGTSVKSFLANGLVLVCPGKYLKDAPPISLLIDTV